MKSKEEMIEIIDDVICMELTNPYREEVVTMDIAKLILKALCEALPLPLTISRGGKIIRSIDKADEYYNQLKRWGE